MTSLNNVSPSNNMISTLSNGNTTNGGGYSEKQSISQPNSYQNNILSSLTSSPPSNGMTGHPPDNLIQQSSPGVFSPPSKSANDKKMVRSHSEEFKSSILPNGVSNSSASADTKKKLIISPKILAPKKNQMEPDEPPISKALEGRMKSNPYIKKFKLPSSEILLNDYSAALYRQILLHGRLYLFTNFICFESKIFGIKTTENIEIKDIRQIRKKSKKFKYIGIEIETTNNKYSFASFLSRDKTYHDLLSAWKDVTGVSHDDASSHSIDEDNDDETVVFEDDQKSISSVTSSSTSSSLQNSNSNQSIQSIQQTQSNQPITNIINPVVDNQQTKSKQEMSTTEIEKHITSTIISNGNENHASSSVSSSTIKTTTTTSSSSLSTIDEKSHQNGNQPVAESSEKSPLDEMYGSVEQYLSKVDAEKSLLESQHSEFQELLSENFNVSVVNFFRALCSDQCNFAYNYHAKRGDSSIVVKNWAHRDRFGTLRELEYVAPVSSPIGPDKTRILETQRYHLSRTKLTIETDTIMLDIPYGDHFRIEARWECTETSQETCKLNIYLCVRFIKKTWFKGKIESGTIKESKASFSQWVTLAKQELQKLLTIKPKSTNTSALSATSASLTISTSGSNTVVLNKNIENARHSDDSPKHHTRSRSRQHLISSSGQVHTSSNTITAPTLTVNNNSTGTPTSVSSNQISPPPSSLPNGLLESTLSASTANIDPKPKDFGHQQKKSISSKSLFKFKTPFGSFSSDSNQVPLLVLLTVSCLLLLYMYLKIQTLNSKIETMENIFKDFVEHQRKHYHQSQTH